MKKLLNKSVFLVVGITILGFFIGYTIKQLPTLENLKNIKNVEDFAKILVEYWKVIAAFIILFFVSVLFRVLQGKEQEEKIERKIKENKRRKNRLKKTILDKVSEEVNQRLKQSFYNRVNFVLNQGKNSSQVENLWEIDLKIGHQPKNRLKNTEIMTIFDKQDVSGRLLILGKPGYGKTTMLLKLAEKLVERTNENSNKPVPVLFSLPNWNSDKQSIKDWLIEEIKEKYGEKRYIVKELIESEEIIPLLDGLDELAVERQELCVRKINDFLKPENWNNPLVVCSRTQEYQSYNTSLQLNNSIELCPYTPEQVYEYLRSTDNEELWESLNEVFLSRLARIPLLLNIIILAASRISINTWQQFHSENERLNYLFDTYISKMLEEPLKGKFENDKTKYWLGWLAERLIEYQLTEFSIEKIQFNWINSPEQISRLNLLEQIYFVITLPFNLLPFIDKYEFLEDYLGFGRLQNFVFRIALWDSGYIPWNYTEFLDYCTNRLFLQRYGGGYRFMHDLLREHFAKKYAE